METLNGKAESSDSSKQKKQNWELKGLKYCVGLSFTEN